MNPRKAEKFWTNLRSTNHLFNKSFLPDNIDRHNLRQEMTHILGKRIHEYPPTLRKYGIGSETSYVNKRRLLQLDNPPADTEFNPNEIKFLRKMNENATAAHKNNWRFRISDHAE